VRFDIEPAADGAVVTFTHEGLDPGQQCYDVCSNAWGMFANRSLKAFIETGTGEPYVFGGDEALTHEDHERLHRQVAESAAAAGSAASSEGS